MSANQIVSYVALFLMGAIFACIVLAYFINDDPAKKFVTRKNAPRWTLPLIIIGFVLVAIIVISNTQYVFSITWPVLDLWVWVLIGFLVVLSIIAGVTVIIERRRATLPEQSPIHIEEPLSIGN